MDFFSSAGTGTLRDSATATVMADALGKRASGSFAMLLRITSDKAGGISGLIRAGGVGGSWKCCMRITIREVPRKGVTPVVISYRMIPSEYRSLRLSPTSPCACSGETYKGVPSTLVVSAKPPCNLAMPKSVRIGTPIEFLLAERWSRMILAGLMSRWIMPFSCA